jgi:hypothetical protein
VQQGRYERLLCGECEKILQRDEQYFSVLWYKRDPLPDPVEAAYLERAGFEFEPFFRFHVSVLWRASVARDAMFSAVSLGPFEETLRQFLFREVVAPEYEPAIYGMILRRPRTHELWNRMVVGPVRSKVDRITTYRFVFGGCSWVYAVSKQGSPLPESLRLTRPGRLVMPVIDYTEEGSIAQAWKAWRRSSLGASLFG